MEPTDNYYFKICDQDINLSNLNIESNSYNHNGFYVYPFEKESEEQFIKDNPFLCWLYELVPFKCGIIKMSPNLLYNFHKDVSRGVCINVLLSHTNSVTLFSEEVLQNQLGKDGKPPTHYSNFEKLDYEINKFYLFNNQIPHAVYNFEGERCLFSIEFSLDKNKLSYPVLKQKIKQWKTSTTDI